MAHLAELHSNNLVTQNGKYAQNREDGGLPNLVSPGVLVFLGSCPCCVLSGVPSNLFVMLFHVPVVSFIVF